MRKFVVSVNGRRYDVTVDEVKTVETETGTATASETAVETTAQATEPAAAPADAVDEATVPDASTGKVLKAPLSGAIVGVAVSVGDDVVEGQVLVQIEALKLTNEVVSPWSGKVVGIHVKPGQQVQSGAAMVSIR